VVKAVCYNPDGHGFENQRSEGFLSIYIILSAVLGPGIYSFFNTNKYQRQKNNVSGEYSDGRRVELPNLPLTV
jgi:hypothetical protein